MDQVDRIWLAALHEAIREAVAEDQDRAKAMGVVPPPLEPKKPKRKGRSGRPTNRPKDIPLQEWRRLYHKDRMLCRYHGRKLGISDNEYARRNGIIFGLFSLDKMKEKTTPPEQETT